MNLIWLPTARSDLRTILDYISDRNLAAANDLNSRIQSYAERLCDHPYIGRQGRIPKTREAVIHPNYILVYRVGADSVEIVNVLHSRRQYPLEVEGGS